MMDSRRLDLKDRVTATDSLLREEAPERLLGALEEVETDREVRAWLDTGPAGAGDCSW
jgi:hypothetical protein